MKAKFIELDVDFVGSQHPADQPTAEDFAAISRYIQEQKKRREAEATQQELLKQAKAQKVA
ncbi:MAG: hypothetical protein EOO60_12630 [Hymenobacter sp.]|nr:MAG: hypothetical protein EOO60_12630 [Hymenobacter sp.]